MSSNPPTFQSIRSQLSAIPPPLLPPGHSRLPALTAQIASLLLHPTLEASLHLLNHDLPSAHFLVRKMQAAPAFEGMLLHAMLHRIEGDYDNARAWYADCAGAAAVEWCWGEEGERGDVPPAVKKEGDGKGSGGGKGDDEWDGMASNADELEEIETTKGPRRGGAALRRALEFVDAVQKLKRDGEGDKRELEEVSGREIRGMLDWCVRRFGTEEVLDASGAWRQSEAHREMQVDMTTGGKGFRKF
ncbi:hypothetical protein W97_01003 [Coniosporium apollinis CBS 100218]|uniref:Uncharacterized protein n=1 Tax=Coniosporium apollinis (strain CBS 100218) TaxID=1168221 RepID=R7YJH2_CONA1|nr:uncharacterized protein W97_01003 [Coniosporium apollinis CBS 100218]EON61786.1 hypothetical protein W97_01003 [Coniosporium apollinis CBS 100218]